MKELLYTLFARTVCKMINRSSSVRHRSSLLRQDAVDNLRTYTSASKAETNQIRALVQVVAEEDHLKLPELLGLSARLTNQLESNEKGSSIDGRAIRCQPKARK